MRMLGRCILKESKLSSALRLIHLLRLREQWLPQSILCFVVSNLANDQHYNTQGDKHTIDDSSGVAIVCEFLGVLIMRNVDRMAVVSE